MPLTADNNRRRQRAADVRTSMITTGKKFIALQAVAPIEVGDELHATSDDGSLHAITDVSVANPTVLTSVAHGLVTGDQVVIVGSDSTPSIDGHHLVTRLDNDTFTVPVNVTVDGTGNGLADFVKGTPNLRDMLTRGQAAPATDI